ncbi:hypothetical protein KAR91_36305 [Candidatus Pacearchaeota archaeon]|nr:hypothetical protein [Candidatus Pacearchaeota archaeon]
MADLGWEDDDATWGGIELTSKDFAPVFLSTTDFYALGFDPTVALDSHIERIAVVHANGMPVLGQMVWPQILGPDGFAIQISLGASETPEGAIDWEGPYNFTIGEDTFVDFAVAGKYLAIRFASSGVAAWTLQSYSIDYVTIGIH